MKLEAHENETGDHKFLPFQRRNKEAIAVLVASPGTVIKYWDPRNIVDLRLI